MAVYPCDIGHHRYPGAQRSAYLSLIVTSRPETRKLRLCPRHFDDFVNDCRDLLERIEEDDFTQASMMCSAEDCTSPREVGIFAKLYPGGEDYTQYAGDFCDAHAFVVQARLAWDQAKSL